MPVYVPPKTSLVSLPMDTTSQKDQALGCKVLAELNPLWNERYNHAFTEALPKIAPEMNLIIKRSKTGKKREDRKQKTKKHIAKQLAENAAMSMLAEGESLSPYNRKRLSMSFEKPEE